MDLNSLTEKSREALGQAQALAAWQNHQAVDVEHLLAQSLLMRGPVVGPAVGLSMQGFEDLRGSRKAPGGRRADTLFAAFHRLCPVAPDQARLAARRPADRPCRSRGRRSRARTSRDGRHEGRRSQGGGQQER